MVGGQLQARRTVAAQPRRIRQARLAADASGDVRASFVTASTRWSGPPTSRGRASSGWRRRGSTCSSTAASRRRISSGSSTNWSPPACRSFNSATSSLPIASCSSGPGACARPPPAADAVHHERSAGPGGARRRPTASTSARMSSRSKTSGGSSGRGACRRFDAFDRAGPQPRCSTEPTTSASARRSLRAPSSSPSSPAWSCCGRGGPRSACRLLPLAASRPRTSPQVQAAGFQRVAVSGAIAAAIDPAVAARDLLARLDVPTYPRRS